MKLDKLKDEPECAAAPKEVGWLSGATAAATRCEASVQSVLSETQRCCPTQKNLLPATTTKSHSFEAEDHQVLILCAVSSHVVWSW